GNNDVHPAASVLPAALHAESWVADRSIAAIDRHRRDAAHRPFFLWASFIKPHPPFDPPAEWVQRFDPRTMPPPFGANDESLLADRDAELQARRKHYDWDHLSDAAIANIRAHYTALMHFHDDRIGAILRHLDETG